MSEGLALTADECVRLFDVLDRFCALTPNGVMTEETHFLGGIMIRLKCEQRRLSKLSRGTR